MNDELKLIEKTAQIKEQTDVYREIADQHRNMRIMTDVESMEFQNSKVGEPDLLSTFEYQDARITKVQNKMASNRLKHLIKEKWAKERYVKELEVLDLIKFLTREDTERIYLTEEEFRVLQPGLEYFSVDPLLIVSLKKSLTD